MLAFGVMVVVGLWASSPPAVVEEANRFVVPTTERGNKVEAAGEERSGLTNDPGVRIVAAEPGLEGK